MGASVDLYEALLDAEADEAFQNFQSAFPFAIDPVEVDAAGEDLLLLLGAQALDANALALALAAVRKADGTLSALPASIGVHASLRDTALGVAEAWLKDWIFYRSDPGLSTNWDSVRLSYSAKLEAATSEGAVPVTAPDYANGRFDWWAMDLAGEAQGNPAAQTIDAVRVPAGRALSRNGCRSIV